MKKAKDKKIIKYITTVFTSVYCVLIIVFAFLTSQTSISGFWAQSLMWFLINLPFVVILCVFLVLLDYKLLAILLAVTYLLPVTLKYTEIAHMIVMAFLWAYIIFLIIKTKPNIVEICILSILAICLITYFILGFCKITFSFPLGVIIQCSTLFVALKTLLWSKPKAD